MTKNPKRLFSAASTTKTAGQMVAVSELPDGDVLVQLDSTSSPGPARVIAQCLDDLRLLHDLVGQCIDSMAAESLKKED